MLVANIQTERRALHVPPLLRAAVLSSQLTVQVERQGAQGRDGGREPVLGEEAGRVARCGAEELGGGFDYVDLLRLVGGRVAREVVGD